MKKLILALLLMVFTFPLLAQMDTDNTRAIVPRTSHYGELGTLGKYWRVGHIDSLLLLYRPMINGIMAGTMIFVDSTIFKASLLKNADSTTLKAGLVAKSDSSAMPGYITRSQIANDSTTRNALLALKVAKSDSTATGITIALDSAWINTTDTLIVPLPKYAVQLDSIGIYQLTGATASVVYKFLYATNARGSWTAVITSPATITSVTTETWQSTLNNRTLPANGVLGILCSTVTTKPKLAALHFLGKHLQSD
jgi:hypothetical protein